jgi:hypothetical protein
MFIIAPLFEGLVKIRILLDIFFSAIFIAAIYAISQKRHVLWIALSLAVPMLFSLWSKYFVTTTFLILFGKMCGVVFYVFIITHFLRIIYAGREISLDLIFGAAVVYLLMALMWASIYYIVETIHPGSFVIPRTQTEELTLPFAYFSFVTITTLGYGEITPLSGLARSLCSLEAVIGQLYIAGLVAWLVGVHVSQSVEKRKA